MAEGAGADAEAALEVAAEMKRVAVADPCADLASRLIGGRQQQPPLFQPVAQGDRELILRLFPPILALDRGWVR